MTCALFNTELFDKQMQWQEDLNKRVLERADGVLTPEQLKEYADFQASQFKDTQLPLYVILRPLPDGKFKEVARYKEGKINDPAAFAAFLRKALGGGTRSATAGK